MNKRKVLRKYIQQNEGIRLYVYKDKLGIRTTGIGFNLEREDARQTLIDNKIDADKVLRAPVYSATNPPEKSKFVINERQANTLLDVDLDTFSKNLNVIFPKFDQMTPGRQVAIFDLAYNVGITRFKGFKQFILAVKANNFSHAHMEIINSKYARQLKNRSERNANAILTGKYPVTIIEFANSLEKVQNSPVSSSTSQDDNRERAAGASDSIRREQEQRAQRSRERAAKEQRDSDEREMRNESEKVEGEKIEKNDTDTGYVG